MTTFRQAAENLADVLGVEVREYLGIADPHQKLYVIDLPKEQFGRALRLNIHLGAIRCEHCGHASKDGGEDE